MHYQCVVDICPFGGGDFAVNRHRHRTSWTPIMLHMHLLQISLRQHPVARMVDQRYATLRQRNASILQKPDKAK